MDFDDHLDAIVAALYLAHFGGAPDYQTNQHYLELFLTLIEQGGDDPAALPEAGKALSEIMFKDSGGDGLVSTNEAFVTLLYQRILGRAPDPEGLAYWTHELDSQITSRGELAALIANAARAYPRDGEHVANRAEVAAAYAEYDNSNASLLPWLGIDGSQIVAGVMGSLTTIDASASTATVIVTLDSARTNHITMGSGDDIIYFQSYRPITLDDHIDGGDGYDTVAFRQNTFTAEEYEAMRNMRNI